MKKLLYFLSLTLILSAQCFGQAVRNGSITSAKITNNTIVNADINTAAAIAWSKLATGTVNRIALTNASGVLTTDDLRWDATNGRLGIGLDPVIGLTIYKSVNGLEGANFYNISGGASAATQVAFNNGSFNSQFRMYGTGAVTSAYVRANGFSVANDGAGVDIVASNASGDIKFWTGGSNLRGTFSSTGALTLTKSLILSTAGETVSIKTGSNACSGSATLSSGTVTVSTTCTGTTWGTDFIIQLTARGSSIGVNRVSTHTAATSFVITSSDVTSTDQIGWTIIKLN